tara:strand:- start:3060 stop:3620 length:561 start_codon:yes stop_codon:yes gene_type:complete
MIRITGGKFKKKRILSESEFVRPTSSLKREAIFSIVQSYSLKNNYKLFENKTILDLFAGIGTIGLEGISRGFSNVIFYENNKKVLKVLEKNCKMLCLENQYKIIEEDIILSNLTIDFKNISLIYIDPPYEQYSLNNLLLILLKKIEEKTIIVIETSVDDVYIVPEKLQFITKKKYGKTNISFLTLS